MTFAMKNATFNFGTMSQSVTNWSRNWTFDATFTHLWERIITTSHFLFFSFFNFVRAHPEEVLLTMFLFFILQTLKLYRHFLNYIAQANDNDARISDLLMRVSRLRETCSQLSRQMGALRCRNQTLLNKNKILSEKLKEQSFSDVEEDLLALLRILQKTTIKRHSKLVEVVDLLSEKYQESLEKTDDESHVRRSCRTRQTTSYFDQDNDSDDNKQTDPDYQP